VPGTANAVEIHHYDGMQIEYDRLDNGNLVVGGIVISKSTASATAASGSAAGAARSGAAPAEKKQAASGAKRTPGSK
jgi:hypothetical protein